MTAISLEEALANANVTPFTGLPDEMPPLTNEPEFACEICGVELIYSGRGRKPKRCDDHKRNNTRRNSIPAGSNDKLAAMATDVLCQVNGIFAMGAAFMTLFRTAGAVNDRDEVFRVQTYEALKTDVALCKKIVSAGSKSAIFSLIVAYGMLAASVAPVALEELKEKREKRLAEQEDEVME